MLIVSYLIWCFLGLVDVDEDRYKEFWTLLECLCSIQFLDIKRYVYYIIETYISSKDQWFSRKTKKKVTKFGDVILQYEDSYYELGWDIFVELLPEF